MSENDPDLSASWRAASREQPPAALDDAIRAAARREVGAKPGRFRATPRWWPLAAAATVAAVAVGIVQMAPPEQVTPAAFPAAADAVQRAAKPDGATPEPGGAQRDAVDAASPEEKRDMSRGEAGPANKEQRSRTADEKRSVASDRPGNFVAAPNAQLQGKRTMSSQPPAQRTAETPERDQVAKQKSELAAPTSIARQSSNAASAPAASTPRNEVQPFPATSTPAETGAAKVSKSIADAAPPPATPTPPSVPAAAPAPAPPPALPLATNKVAAQSSVAGAPSGAIAGNRGGSTSKDTGDAEPERAKERTALGRVAAGDADKPARERRKDATPLAPDEWIKRIRRLIAEGRNEDAARELAAFRREYKERAESLLPGDLRTFRP